MKFSKLNKYILQNIFSFIDFKIELNLIKYNKALMKKLDITKYTYQRRFFTSIINPSILKNPSVLLNNNLFDKKTLDKLMSDWEKEKTGIFKGNNFFTETTDSETLENLTKAELSNLVELNITDDSIDIPCEILSNLEILSLQHSHVKLLSNNSNISLDKLKKLYINNITIEDTDLKIKVNNLKYLDLRFNLENDDDEFGFINLFEKLIEIFDFNFLSVFKMKEKSLVYDDLYLNGDYYAKKLFEENFLKKLDYLRLEIEVTFNRYCGGGGALYRVKNVYKFSKTKGNKYIFKTIYKNKYNGDNGDWWNYYFAEKELRLCNDINYNNYYYSNKDLEVYGNSGEFSFDKNINTFTICDYDDFDFHDNFYDDWSHNEDKRDHYLNLLGDLDYETLKIIDLNYLGEEAANDFINNIKKFLGLGSLYIHECEIKNQQLMNLFKNLSIIKSLLYIDINFNKVLKLSKNNKNEISKLFPDISFNKKNKRSSINWINHNIDFSSK